MMVPYISTKKLPEGQLSFLSQSFILFLPPYHYLQDFVFELMNIKGWTVFQNTVQKPFISINFKTSTEIQHSLVHWYKAPNHDELLYLQIRKNYSLIHIILNENESYQHKCWLKVTNLVKF